MNSIIKVSNTKVILILIFIIAVFVDAANGILQKKVGVMTPIGIIYRGTIYSYLFSYLLKNRYKTIIYIFSIFVLLSLLLWVVLYDASLFKEAEFLIRYSFFFVLLNFFYIKKRSLQPKYVYKIITQYGFLISSIIIICYITGFGISTYGEGEYGWGEKGLFIATNDIGLTILCSLICSCIYHNNYSSSKWTILFLPIIAVGGILIGSRVCFLFIPFTLFLYVLYKAKQTKNKLIVTISIALMVYLLVYVGILIYSMLDDYALSKLTKEGFENARSFLTDEAQKHISNFDALSFLIGKGANNLHSFVGARLGLGTERYVEADYYEIIGSFGYFLGGIIICYYLKIVLKSIKCFFAKRVFESFEIMYLTLSFIVIAFFAGHAATNMMAAPILAVTSILLWKKSKINGKGVLLKYIFYRYWVYCRSCSNKCDGSPNISRNISTIMEKINNLWQRCIS